ncbi:MAG: gamma-glutamyltransferase family protein, partial [Burkholderiaceae bacterium]|nr:gamma-glutamyltransferase family protein [Burkholderiaceae bacterium]
QAGLRMLAAGGNAVDAAIAAAAAMTIVEPCSNGLGSDAFCILWDGTQLHGLNASGTAPAAWTPEYFRRKHGDGATTPPQRGWDSVSVPGAVASWVALSQRFGKLPFADLLAPAIDIAERGYLVPVVIAEKWMLAAQVADLVSQPGFAQTFLPKGRAPVVGELFRMPAAARMLRALAETKGQALYGGEIAESLARCAREQGGAHTVADFAAYKPEWVAPIRQDYRGHTLHEIPPNGQGIAALMALGILQHFDVAALPVDGTASFHLQIEAMKLAFADVYRFVSERSTMEVTTEQLLDPAYLASRAKLIDPKRAQDFGAGNPVKGGTIYLTAADESGMMVSFIQSNYMGFGSGVVIPDWGLSLQNRGQPVMSFGVMGGDMQPQGHMQTLVRMLDYQQHPQAACDAPRWRFNLQKKLNLEPGVPADTVQGLKQLGHVLDDIQDSYQDFGAGQFIWRMGDPAVEGYAAASDPRRDGLAAGF